MLTLPTDVLEVDDRPAYRPFRATVSRLSRLSTHFVRVTFTGDDFGVFGTAGLDQRVKIVLPIPGIGLSDIGCDDPQCLADGDWYSRWRALPDGVRNPFRTYTVRAIRPELRELDVDFVFHGDGGPAARWLLTAKAGDEVIIVGPDARSIDARIGLDWHPGRATQLLLAGDETAVPAVCGILESLPAGVTARVFLEVPSAADVLEIDTRANATISWLPRTDAPHGSLLIPAVREWIGSHRDLIRAAVLAEPQPIADIDVDLETLWDSPAEPDDSDQSDHGDFYAWLAGESAVIKTLRRCLVTEHGIDRSRVAFMGYWRLGKAEAQ
jgi:NADPH-dependent ferric siderophore reductase